MKFSKYNRMTNIAEARFRNEAKVRRYKEEGPPIYVAKLETLWLLNKA